MIFLQTLILFLILLFIFTFLSPKLKLIDEPNFRKKHKGSVPVIGGLILYATFLFITLSVKSNYYFDVIVYASSLLIILGAIDDAIEIGVIFRLINQLICCLIVIGSGLMIKEIGNYYIVPNIEIGVLSLVFTVICVIGLTNSFNFIDGQDGLCSGLSLISIFNIILIIYFSENFNLLHEITFLTLISFAIGIFIFFNITNLNKIFLGDSGSTFLGFFISWLLVYYSQGDNSLFHPVLTLWCVALPVLDLFSVVIRRLLRKSNPFKPDRRHLHHILIDLGYSSKITVLLILNASFILNLFGFAIFYFFGPFFCLIIFFLVLFAYVLSMVKLSRKANLT